MDKGPLEKLERTIGRTERSSTRSERPEKIRLGELLVELRLITSEQLSDLSTGADVLLEHIL